MKTLRKIVKKVIFKFRPFSVKQTQVLTWWCDSSPVKDHDGIIADGAIRSGKTVSMALSFVMWALYRFEGQNFGMCGKTINSFRRNVWFWLKIMLWSRGYTVQEVRTENLIIVERNGKVNYFYIFGGKDESSQDLIQGITLAGIFFDEVALMPESFVNQGTGRCSVAGSKYWFNCNPQGPLHWFKVNWIDKARGKRILYLHFTQDDNLSLGEHEKERYRRTYVGVFFKRYILGLWVMAEGAIYDMWDELKNTFADEEFTEEAAYYCRRYILVDYGTTNPMVFLDIRDDGKTLWIVNEYYWDSRKEQEQKTDKQYADDLIAFIGPEGAERVVIDPSAASFIAELKTREDRTFIISEADNEVLDGIRMTASMIAAGLIRVHKTKCANVLKEITSYVWDEKAAQRGEEKPVKVADHTCDAMRYGVKTIIKPYDLANRLAA